jgi:hypothetical protein
MVAKFLVFCNIISNTIKQDKIEEPSRLLV